MFSLIINGVSTFVSAPIVGSVAQYLFPFERTVKVIKHVVNISNSTNPVGIVKNVNITVLECSALPPVRLAFHCLALAGTAGAMIISPNPITGGCLIHLRAYFRLASN